MGVSAVDTLILRVATPDSFYDRKAGNSLVVDLPTDTAFSSVAPGGYEALRATIPWPAGVPRPSCVMHESVVQVLDGRSGAVVWHGHVIDPGGTLTTITSAYQVTAHGYQTEMDAAAAALAYIDRDPTRWLPQQNYPPGSAQWNSEVSLPAHTGDWVDRGEGTWQFDIPEGAKVDASTPSHDDIVYLPAKYVDATGGGNGSGQDIEMVLFTAKTNVNSVTLRAQVRVTSSSGTVYTPYQPLWDDINGAHDHSYIFEGAGSWSTTAAEVVTLRWQMIDPTDYNSPQDRYLRFGNLAVVYSLVDTNGVAAGAPSTYLPAWRIVYDVIGRLLRNRLEITAAIASPDTLVEHAAWFEGVTARGVFDFLEDLTGGTNYWAVWEPGATGRARFSYVPWDVEPRYVITPDVCELDLAGGSEGLVNEALVAYVANRGVPASVKVVGYAADLNNAGITRTMLVDATDKGQISKATAIQAGKDAMSRQDVVRLSGRARVSGPVWDRRDGRWVEPWELRAGWQGVFGGGELRSRGKAVENLSARDGRSVWRITGTQFTASDGVCELTLDGGGRTAYRRVRREPPMSARRYRPGDRTRVLDGRTYGAV
jgi:hypothetical protein